MTAMFAPAAAASFPAMGSAFLTGAGSAAGFGAATALGNKLQGSGVNFRGKYARNLAKHNRAQIGPDMAERMKAIDAAGLHRLAALGVSFGPSSAGSQPGIPGQSPLGSAMKSGVQAAMDFKQNKVFEQQAQTLGALKIQEQRLRNAGLAQNLRNSATSRAADIANSRRPSFGTTPSKEEEQRRFFLSRNKKTFTSGPGSRQSDLEDEFGEWADYFPSVLGNAWDAWKQDFRNIWDIPKQGLGPDWLRSEDPMGHDAPRKPTKTPEYNSRQRRLNQRY